MWKKIKELFLYLIFGILTTSINIIVFHISYKICAVSMIISNIFAWISAVLFAYITNKKFVFESNTNQPLKEMFSFYIARIITLIIETIFLYIFINILKIDSFFSKIISNIIVIVLNYIFSKLWIFKS
jgi:putative flippase GtrA